MTGRQKRAAAALAGLDSEERVQRAAEAAGVSLETLAGWMAGEEFKRQYRELADRESDAERGAVWQALVDQCQGGNLAAIKLYFELKAGPAGKGNRGEVRIVDDV